ncbi:DUF368 domain-containing protein [Dietzia sp. HMSC21D01]|uniref:DUF368 domain-containing protein n=1 Tax=Dietzia cinnamea TaxID=321318 RepID=A0AAW5Q641_9ACTN|nr:MULTISPECIES: DUF368 domain-containing protein [Dietzia]MCT1862834.1 DUF368 domain-containing protein [Dietzia cinnamea]MCT2028588.1 DUF368 domain-containing protein [Dietzia cinnamea]MCT2032111.1 DUF368 domain-containing protein [Dietzia cinnamea]MCT2074985.1 DUF368 domain-containing protein [Dietzia cinnamea]MCT2104972.1 DUF368 domain-containing protein [Dietzia cinnamea]
MAADSSTPAHARRDPVGSGHDPVDDADLDPRSPVPTRPGPLGMVGNAVRGALIGMAELVPGVSGGTVALVTGVYPRLLDSGAHVVDGLRSAALGPDRRARTRAAFRHVDWWLLLPMAVGMLAVVFTVAGVMKGFVEGSPEIARGLFLGMVAASIAVPLGMARATPGGRNWVLGLVFVLGAVFAFVLSGLPSGSISDPSYLLVFVAAAVAICALVLPGVSGSYLLLAMGLYAPTLGAVDERDFAYLGVFALGALVGISLFVKVLDRLLEDFRKPTLVAMAGLMLGSLRALWPWQTEEADVLAPGSDWPAVLAAVVAGVAVVLIVLAVEKAFAGKTTGTAATGTAATDQAADSTSDSNRR